MHYAVRIATGLAGFALCCAGAVLLIAGIVLAAAATSDADRTPLYFALIVVGAVVALAGAGLYIFASRTVAAVSAGLVAAWLLMLGPGLILLGFAFEQVSTTRFDRDRAALAAWLTGAGMLVIGAVLLGLALWWANSAAGQRRLHRVAQVLAFWYGSGLFLQGLSYLFLVVLPFRTLSSSASGAQVHQAARVVSTTLFAGGAMLSLLPGAILVYHGVSSYMRVPSRPLRPPPSWIPALLFFAAIALGALVLATGVATAALLPPLHVIASISAPLALLALAMRQTRRADSAAGMVITWRQALLMLAWGMSIAASIAITLELFTLGYAILGVLLAQHQFQDLSTARQYVQALGNSSSEISKTLRLIFLLITVALLGPLIEEFSKGFGVRLFRSARPSRYQAFVLGLAGGAGFATVEAIEYGFGALNQDVHRWWDTVLLRGGSGSLHALASGIVGLGWYYVFAGNRARGIALFLLAVGLHSSWNALNVLTVARILPYFEDLSDRSLEIGLEVFLGVLSLGLIALIASLSNLLAREEEANEAVGSRQ